MYFPLSGEIVDAKGNVMAAPEQMLIAYEQKIASALFRVQMQTLHSETYKKPQLDHFSCGFVYMWATGLWLL